MSKRAHRTHRTRRLATPLLASSPRVWREALVWLHVGDRGTRGSSSSIFGQSQRRTPTSGLPQHATHPPRQSSRRWLVANSASTYLRQTATESHRKMNKYTLIAQEHWKTHAPSRYANLTDPETFFQTMGESAANQVDQIAASLEARLAPDLPYLERVGQMNAIRLQAEESVLSDLVYSVESDRTSLVAELEQMIGDLSTPTLSTTQEQRMAQLTALLPLVTLEQEPDEMTEPAIRDRILALRPFWNHETRSLATP